MALPTYGSMAVDWENRVDFDRLRRERLARAKSLLQKSEMGSLLCFDMNNVRYLTATHIGTWAQDKANRFTLLPQNDEPILWDFGSAAKHHQLHCPWLGERSRAGISVLRGAMTPEMGRAEDVAKKIRIELEMRGLSNRLGRGLRHALDRHRGACLGGTGRHGFRHLLDMTVGGIIQDEDLAHG